MSQTLDRVLDRIAQNNPVHGKRLRTDLWELGAAYVADTEGFLGRYESYLSGRGRSLDQAVDSYLRFVGDMVVERVEYLSTGKYRHTSFEEVNRSVYNNPDVMAYHMEGLLLSQFLWRHHYEMLVYFRRTVEPFAARIGSYLDVGAGHGIYVDAFAELARPGCTIDVVDISPTSLEMCKQLVKAPVSRYLLKNIFDFTPEKPYDFITMGEVLEHVEDPVGLLQRLRQLLADDGRVFITTPTNAPTIDHIYLFRDTAHIREIISAAGFEVVSDVELSSERTSPERVAKHKLTVLYGAILKPTKPNTEYV